jgi:hypothetical protein
MKKLHLKDFVKKVTSDSQSLKGGRVTYWTNGRWFDIYTTNGDAVKTYIDGMSIGNDNGPV